MNLIQKKVDNVPSGIVDSNDSCICNCFQIIFVSGINKIITKLNKF